MDAWYSEVNCYHFNKPGWSVLAGHFSAMVWRDTTRIGCAVNSACTWPTYICQYSPPGNVVDADWASQVRTHLTSTGGFGANSLVVMLQLHCRWEHSCSDSHSQA